MKHLLFSTSLGLLLTLSAGHVQAQEENDFTPMVLVGAISASVSLDEIEFANLPSGKVIRIGENGVEVLEPDQVSGIDPSVPRLSSGAVVALPDGEREALTQRLGLSLEQLLTAYDDGMVSEDDTIEIVKFLLGVDLPWDERLRNDVDSRFGPILDAAVDSDGNSTDGIVRQSVPIAGGDNLLEDNVQVTDPIDTTNDYFTPGG